jgi:hypothetical protein
MQAIGNVNALPALIGDVIYEPSDCYFRCPLSLKPFLAQHNRGGVPPDPHCPGLPSPPTAAACCPKLFTCASLSTYYLFRASA